MEKRLLIAGSGGQGILFLGKLMAYAAMLMGKEVTWFPSYGAEVRGGTTNCTVIISDEMIGSPVVRTPDILVAMNEASCERFSKALMPGGLLVCDDSFRERRNGLQQVRTLWVPALRLSATLQRPQSANMIMAGALVASTGLLDISAVLRALEEITPGRLATLVGINKDIIMKGYESVGDTES